MIFYITQTLQIYLESMEPKEVSDSADDDVILTVLFPILNFDIFLSLCILWLYLYRNLFPD